MCENDDRPAPAAGEGADEGPALVGPALVGPALAVPADPGPVLVELRGEIDLFTAAPLAARLDALTAGPRPDLLVDLRPVSFIDCGGLGVLLRARNRALARRGRLRLISDGGVVRRVLRLTGLAKVFEVLPGPPGVGPPGGTGSVLPPRAG
ncbi:STAS domain-containing protein [Streptomyces sp. NPDC091281]|uniref:STAS domain-containing protein n=1 Tax=Streptomyces sp. NPDC091281 TaxID=3365985 RepID=UPI0037FD6A1A